MLNKILNIFNKEKTMEDLKEDQATEAMVESIVEEVKQEEVKKEAEVVDTEEFPNFIDRSKKD